MNREELREKLKEKIDWAECDECIHQESLLKCIDGGVGEGFDCTPYCGRCNRDCSPIYWFPTDKFLDEIIELCQKEEKAE